MAKRMANRSVEELVAEYVDIDIRLSQGLPTKENNRLCDRLGEVYFQIRCRGEEGEKAFDALFDHPHPSVRMAAAQLTYYRNPERSLSMLRELEATAPFPINADASISLGHILDYKCWTDVIERPRFKERYEQAMAKLKEEGKS